MNNQVPAIKGGSPVRSKKKFLVFGSPIIEKDEMNEVLRCMKTGWLGTGPKVHAFEEDFRKFKDAPFAVALNSCTAALHLSLLSAGIGRDDEVITTAMTFCATVNAIIHSGARPVLADCELDTMNINPADIERKITPKTKAIIIVHFAGRPCKMDEIQSIAKKHNILIIEDCAHAIESEYKGHKTGTFGDFGCFSFYVTKNIVTGEGGMVISPHENYINRLKILALHGMSKDAWKRFSDEGYKHYQVVECGYKANMMDIQAAIGLQQLKRIEKYHARREQIWKKYNKAFANLPVKLPEPPQENTKHAYHLYTVLIDKEATGITRDYFLEALTKENIGAGVHYQSIPEHPYYQKTFGFKPQDYPNAHKIGQQTVSLPLSAKLKEGDVSDVISAVTKILRAQ